MQICLLATFRKTRWVVVIFALALAGCKESKLQNATKDDDKKVNKLDPQCSSGGHGRALNRDAIRSLQKRMLDTNVSPENHTESARAMSDWLQSMPVDDLVALIASLDPKTGEADGKLLIAAINALARRDPERAMVMAVRLPQGYCTPYFYQNLIEADPNAVAKWISSEGLKSPAASRLALLSAIELARSSPEVALGLLRSGNSEMIKQIGMTVLSEIAKSDPVNALGVAKGLSGELRVSALTAVLRGYSMADPAGAFSEIAKIEDPLVAKGAYPTLFRSWFDLDPNAAGKALAQIPGPDIQNVLSGNGGQLSKLIGTDKDLAIAVLDKLVFTDANSSIFLSAASELARNDVATALAWVQSFPDSPKKGDLIREVTIARAGSDPAQGVPVILKEFGGYRTQLIEGAATSWARTDPRKALEYTNSLDEGEQSVFATSVLQSTLAGNLQTAIDCISHNSLSQAVKSSAGYAEIVRSLATRLASSDLQEAVKWSGSLSGTEQAAAVSGISLEWSKRDPAAVGNWIQSLPIGRVRDSAVRSLIEQIGSTDPEAAAKWAETLQAK